MVSEDEDHRTLVKMLSRSGIFFEHPPLGGSRNKGSGRAMKELGAKAGSSDFRIYDIPPRFPEACGVSFELKRRGKPDGLPAHQESFLVLLGVRGWVVGWGDIHDAIAWWRWLGYDV